MSGTWPTKSNLGATNIKNVHFKVNANLCTCCYIDISCVIISSQDFDDLSVMPNIVLSYTLLTDNCLYPKCG